MTHGQTSASGDAGEPAGTPPSFDSLLQAAGATDGSPTGDSPGDEQVELLEMGNVPAQEVILRVTMVLLSAAAEKLGLSADDPSASPHLDLDEARRLIDALAGLVAGSADYLGPQARTVRAGLQALQLAFRESSAYPDEPGRGPGEKFTGKVY